MSRIAKFRPEKAKVKVVFRLQFHATHIPQPGWDKLFVSFIPTDSGKTTAKTTKATVRNGSCKWSDPIYETARLLQDSKTKRYDEKLYKLVVAMGTSRSSILGEATINLADYADASNPSVVALSLHGSNQGTLLHVTVQLLSSKTGFREFEQQREFGERRFQMTTVSRVYDEPTEKVSSSAELASYQIDKASPRVRFKSDSMGVPSFEEAMLNEDCADSGIGIDGSSHTSESLCAEKHEVSSIHEVDSLKSTASCDLVGFSPSQVPQPEKGDPCDPRLLAQGSNDWVHGWSSDYSMDCDLSAAYEENSRLKVSLEIAEASIQELKQEVNTLQRLADQLGVETQGFSQQLATEIASGQNLARDVCLLKSECSKLKDDICQHKHPGHALERSVEEGYHANEYQPDAEDIMGNKISLLLSELEVSKAERNSLVRKMGQMELYYESLIQQLEISQKQMIDELQSLRNEHSTCLYTISSLESQMENLHLDMNEQFIRFSKERQDIDALNKELERRTTASEAALKRLKWNYSLAADQLQKDLELLSFQVLSMFETNENLVRHAFEEASQLYAQHSEKFGTKAGEVQSDMKVTRTNECEQISNVNGSSSRSKGILKSRLFSWEGDAMEPKEIFLNEEPFKKNIAKSFSSDDELTEKQETVFPELYVQNVYLGIYSHILQETLHEANREIKLLKRRINSAAQQLECEDESRGLLTVKFQSALKDIEVLKSSEAENISKCNDLMTKNHMLEVKLHNLSFENDVLAKKISENEAFFEECRNYEIKYEVCTGEKNKLEAIVEQDRQEKSLLHGELSSAHEELRLLKTEFDNQSSLKEYLERTVNFLQGKLGFLESRMVVCLEQISGQAYDLSELEMEPRDVIAMSMHLEELQRSAFELILQISQEKKDIEAQRDMAQESLSSTESRLLLLKENFESDVEDLQMKLKAFNIQTEELEMQLQEANLSVGSLQLDLHQANLNAEKLQIELQEAADKLMIGSEFEKRHAEKSKELVLKIAELEDELQLVTYEKMSLTEKVEAFQSVNTEIADKLKTRTETEERHTEKNKELSARLVELEDKLQLLSGEHAHLIQSLEIVNNELVTTKSALTDYKEKNKALMESLHAGKEESVKLVNELSSFEERLGYMHDELQAEKGSRDELESKLRELNSQLTMKNEQLVFLDSQRAEFTNLKQQVAAVELENARLKDIMLNCEESRKKAAKDASLLCFQVSDLESNVDDMHEQKLAADVQVMFMKSETQVRIHELQEQFKAMEICNEELHLKYADAITTLNSYIASEAQHVRENEKLKVALESTKSELEIVTEENRKLESEICSIPGTMVELSNGQETQRQEIDVEHLENTIMTMEKEMDKMSSSKDELEIMVTVLRSKLDEQQGQILLQQKYCDELMRLQNDYKELHHKLAEQILQTEEFKNLSLHLKELKDRAEAECLQAREKRESEGPLTSTQESLRIAFIREQCESKLQELRSQLYASKKHAEEMLLKLQGALDELETRKKCEASLAKINEDLSMKILELEDELQVVLTEKREKVNAYDRMKAELECSVMSLECCKEENVKLEASLQECNEERTKLATELGSMKEVLKRTSENTQNLSSEVGVSKPVVPELGASDPVLSKESKASNLEMTQQTSKVDAALKSAHEYSRLMLIEQRDMLQNNLKLALVDEIGEEQSLKIRMDRMHKELERLKDGNSDSLLSEDEHHEDPGSQGLQRELLQLDLANERLETIFPLFKGLPGSGNALERVLALEVELAESLQSKKKSNIHFQSSFLKQHSDDEAILRSFRDINELIKDMLEMKRRYGGVETELKEMHERYSQLSLRFAEVEGERQKLLMTLKNIRLPKKA